MILFECFLVLLVGGYSIKMFFESIISDFVK